MNLRPFYILTALNALLLLVTAFFGLFKTGTYIDFIEPLHLAESRGQDFTTLFVGLPLLALAVRWTRRRDVRGVIFWAGALGYFLYVYLIYAYGGVYNSLFFAYLAVCAISLFSMIGLLWGISPKEVEAVIGRRMPWKATAVYFILTAILLSVMWGALALEGIAAKTTADANVIIVNDFLWVIPGFVLAAVWLWKRRVWGVILAGVLFVQAVTLGISITAGQVTASLEGLEPTWDLAAFFLIFTIFGLGLAFLYTINLKSKPAG